MTFLRIFGCFSLFLLKKYLFIFVRIKPPNRQRDQNHRGFISIYLYYMYALLFIHFYFIFVLIEVNIYINIYEIKRRIKSKKN